MHSHMINSEYVLKSSKILLQTKGQHGDDIKLYGEPSNLAAKVFGAMPVIKKAGETDIVSFGNDDRVILMIRDLGHATTIEITKDENSIKIQYFIPKICNIDMINALPGINKISNTEVGATGIFYTTNEKFLTDFYDFVSNIPDDLDMVLYDEKNGEQLENEGKSK